MTPTPAAVADAQVWVVDLDGVLWLAGEPIGDVASAIGALRDRGVRVVFATNNSAPTTEQLVARLARVGIDAEPDDLVTINDKLKNGLPDAEKPTATAENPPAPVVAPHNAANPELPKGAPQPSEPPGAADKKTGG